MTQTIGQCLHRICRFVSCLVLTLTVLGARPTGAQSVVTQPLAVTSVCAGSQLDVTGRKVGLVGDLAVEIASDGKTFSRIPSAPLSTSASDEVTYRATIPKNTPAGSTYRIRLVANDPTTTSIPSPTLLIVRSKPARPKVDSLITDCMRVLPSGDLSTYVSTTVAAGATLNRYSYYNNTLNKDSRYYNRFNSGSVDYVIFESPKAFAPASAYKYPVEEHVYYCTQTVDGCESDTAKVTIRVLYRPYTGPMPTNGKAVTVGSNSNWPDTYYGTLAYCTGDKAVPLNVNGHAAAPENYRVSYRLLDSLNQNGTSFTPPLPDTRVASRNIYELRLVPTDPTKACSSWTGTQLIVTVDPPPSATLTGSQTIVEGQAVPVSLSVALSGKSPWTFVYQDSSAVGLGNPVSLTANTSPYVVEVTPQKTTMYRIKRVNNGCSNDTVNTSAIVTVIPLLGIEEPSLANTVAVYPVPATTALTITIKGLAIQQRANLQLVDLTGQVISQQEIRQHTTSVPLDRYPAGIYWLIIQLGEAKIVRRIVKL